MAEAEAQEQHAHIMLSGGPTSLDQRLRPAGRAEASDAEPAAPRQTIQLAAMRGEERAGYTVFTNSQEAMQRILGDSRGLGQAHAALAIRFAQAIYDRGPTIDTRWVPGHSEVEGNE